MAIPRATARGAIPGRRDGQLASMSKTGTALSFSYDHNGLRTQKSATVSGVTTTTNYYLNGKQIVHLTQGSNTLPFFYDAQGKPAMVQLQLCQQPPGRRCGFA